MSYERVVRVKEEKIIKFVKMWILSGEVRVVDPKYCGKEIKESTVER